MGGQQHALSSLRRDEVRDTAGKVQMQMQMQAQVQAQVGACTQLPAGGLGERAGDGDTDINVGPYLQATQHHIQSDLDFPMRGGRRSHSCTGPQTPGPLQITSSPYANVGTPRTESSVRRP